MAMTTPTTEAGRALHARLFDRNGYYAGVEADIIAIEQEAVAAALAEVERRVRIVYVERGDRYVPKADILAIIREVREQAALTSTEPGCRHEFTMLSSPPTCAKCGAKASEEPTPRRDERAPTTPPPLDPDLVGYE